jgi:TfoX/Sxy family transcriptional regulator of competence genes
MTNDLKTLQALMALAVPDRELLFRPMFRLIMVYAAGRPLAALTQAGLALKMHGEDHAALLAIVNATRWQYDGNAPLSKNYIVLPDDILHDTERLRAWTLRAIAGLPPAKAKPAKRSKRRAGA